MCSPAPLTPSPCFFSTTTSPSLHFSVEWAGVPWPCWDSCLRSNAVSLFSVCFVMNFICLYPLWISHIGSTPKKLTPHLQSLTVYNPPHPPHPPPPHPHPPSEENNPDFFFVFHYCYFLLYATWNKTVTVKVKQTCSLNCFILSILNLYLCRISVEKWLNENDRYSAFIWIMCRDLLLLGMSLSYRYVWESVLCLYIAGFWYVCSATTLWCIFFFFFFFLAIILEQ